MVLGRGEFAHAGQSGGPLVMAPVVQVGPGSGVHFTRESSALADVSAPNKLSAAKGG